MRYKVKNQRRLKALGCLGCGMFETKVKDKDVGAKPKLAPQLSIDRGAIYALLDALANDIETFFSAAPTWTVYGGRLIEACASLKKNVPVLKELVTNLQEIAPKYDFDERTPGNGFRSMVCVCDTVVLQLISVLRICIEQRNSLIFRLSYYCKELEAYERVVEFLLKALPQMLATSAAMPEGSLFPPLEGEYTEWHNMLKGVEQLNSSCFYGRPLGFQFSPSCGRIFRFIGIILATYSLSWERGHGAIGSLINSGRFFLSPEQRAARIIKVTKEADIEFCKGFWNLSELGNNVPKWFCPNMAVNELREINWVGPISMETNCGGSVKIPEPSSHTGLRPVRIRVLSHLNREGVSQGVSNVQPLSPYLLFHCHGGGYVATSSKSHETYLRVWAKLLNCTVVSVEYSLAPENPYPRPGEEVLFAYAWIVNNPHLVGWTGERICMVGDSAGGNLIMSVNLKMIELDVKRKPDGLVPVYTPFLFQYLPSPSRLLSVMDPLLHMGVVLRCVAAYTGAYTIPKDEDEQSENAAVNGHKSLQEYVEQVQRTQRIDFSGGSQSIVSLVNIAQQNNSDSAPTDNSFFQKKNESKKGQELNKNDLTKEINTQKENTQEEDSDTDSNADNQSSSSVRVDADPLHIHISPTVFDANLVEFLKKHPITKNEVVWTDEKGELLPCPEGPIDDAEDATAVIEKKGGILSGMGCSVSTQSISVSLKESSSAIPTSVSSKDLDERESQEALSVQRRSLSQSWADSAVLVAGTALKNFTDWLDKPYAKPARPKLERASGSQETSDEEPPVEKKSHLVELLNSSQVPRDPLISPMYASNEEIRQLPPCYFLACHLDPLLDDTIAFARKLKDAGGRVESVDILPHVPHGFLNFTLMSPECRDGAKLCLNRIKQALGTPSINQD